MREDGSVTAGQHLRVQLHRRSLRQHGAVHEDVLIVRCDGVILYRQAFPKAQARDVHQIIKTQLKALSLDDFIELWSLREVFEEPNALW